MHHHRLKYQLPAKSELSPSSYQLRSCWRSCSSVAAVASSWSYQQVYSLSLYKQSQSYQLCGVADRERERVCECVYNFHISHSHTNTATPL